MYVSVHYILRIGIDRYYINVVTSRRTHAMYVSFHYILRIGIDRYYINVVYSS